MEVAAGKNSCQSFVPIAELFFVFGFSSCVGRHRNIHPVGVSPPLLTHFCVSPSCCGSGRGKPSGCGLHGECSSDGGGGCRVTLLQSGLGDLYVTAGSFLHGKAEQSLGTQLPGR